jgi:hypothetical protein
VGADVARGTEAAAGLLEDLPGRGAATAEARARFFRAAGIGGGARWRTLAQLGCCGVTTVSTSRGRGHTAFGVVGMSRSGHSGVGGGGPDCAMT